MMNQVSSPATGLKFWMQIAAICVLVGVAVIWVAGSAAKARLIRQYPPPGQMVNVGGFAMHIHCTGQGSPTVVLVSGLDDFSITWSLVQPQVAEASRACSYDRAGMGWSEASSNPRTSANMVKELHTLLVNAQVGGPYVLVGHSFGGALAQLYAKTYPEEVAGMVLIDAAPTGLFERVPAWRKSIEKKLGFFRILMTMSESGLLALYPGGIPNRGFPEGALAQYRAISAATDYYKIGIAENEAFEGNLAEIKSAGITSFGKMPVVVLSRGMWDAMPGLTPEENQQARQAWTEMQSELLALSSNSRQVVADQSEHFIQLQQPQLVIDAIKEVMHAARQ